MRITAEDRRGNSRSVYVADDILKNKNAARNGSFGNDSDCGEGTTVVLMKEIWGAFGEEGLMKHNPRDKWTAEKYTQKAKGEGKWAVDQPGSAFEAGQTDWGNKSGWRVGVEWTATPSEWHM